MPQCQLSTTAFGTLAAHCTKYPWQAVQGVLLAPVNSTAPVQVTQAIPISHLWCGLAPMVEIALQQVQLFCEKNKLRVAGFYYANELKDDQQLTSAVEAIADKILAQNPEAIVLLINNQELHAADQTGLPLIPFEYQNKHWSRVQGLTSTPTSLSSDTFTLSLESPETWSTVRRLLTKVASNKVNVLDFDDHLQSPSGDWMENAQLWQS
ncbi:hypothetical protein H4R33_003112 [Dimargaris cristalligena]|uniref:MPN domain-containing protein n=1 Tax=Dimargaris cristalligena TaxID=215637 RepID=A0A4P9ZX89_9FUNG|nr:hypothetical protein H4R33_003112 [Dimargaris cristalligena]RKP37631.1 hypothetical protein BJ085DRAFT_35654 [Dimargaris cristalligena]|eukprot:RKP37631.1 hypothetical protein BJ085DRAFT_35654 [Dimargaris cristalligena]